MSGSIRIVDMPDLGAFTADSSVVGEHAGSGRFSGSALINYFLPLAGGNVTGKTTVTINTSDLAPNTAATTFETWLNTSGSTPGFSISAQTRLNVTGGTTHANRYANPAISFWSSAIKYIPTGGLPAGMTQLQDQWTYIGNNIDATNGPSSVGGVLISEYDTTANHRDDGTQRSGAVYAFDLSWPIGPPPAPKPSYGPPPLTGGWPAAFNSGMSFSSGNYCVMNIGIAMGLQYSTALLDTRGSRPHSGTIQTTVPAGGTVLHVSNVVGYMQWGSVSTSVSVSNPMPVLIGANRYLVTSAVFDAAVGGVTTTLGTLTLSSGIIGTDGTAGNTVGQDARTIWLADGQQICLAASGDSYLRAIEGALLITASNFVQVSNNFQAAGMVTAGGTMRAYGQLEVGNPAAPGSSNISFNSSGNSTADVLLAATGGSGVNDGLLTIQAGGVNLHIPSLSFTPLPTNATNDAAAAAAGVPFGVVYRNGSIMMIRAS